MRNDRLGTLVRELCTAFDKAGSWESFVKDFRGPSYLSDELDDIDHPAAPPPSSMEGRRCSGQHRHRTVVLRAEGRVHPARVPPIR